MNKRVNGLSYKLLDASLIATGFVKGETSCNYEIYLTEVINYSTEMRQRYKKEFKRAISEANGECDVYSGDYGLDFKLIASKTAIQGRRLFSPQFHKFCEGVIARGPSQREGSMKATRIAQALRGKTQAELLEIKNTATKKQGIENDIKTYMETLETKKNLMLFFPYSFSTEDKDIGDLQLIVDEIQMDFSESLMIRSSNYPSLDTFFIFVYDASFVLCEWKNERLSLIEKIPTNASKTYTYLSETYCERGILGI